MIRNPLPRFLILVGLMSAFAGCSPAPSYTTYEDCILVNVKANQSREAVRAITKACRAKFPDMKPALAISGADYEATMTDAAQAAADTAANAADAADAADAAGDMAAEATERAARDAGYTD